MQMLMMAGGGARATTTIAEDGARAIEMMAILGISRNLRRNYVQIRFYLHNQS